MPALRSTAMPLAAMLAALALAAAAPCAVAQSKSDADKEKARIDTLRAQVRFYRCVTKEGRKYYDSIIPQQCEGALIEALSGQGRVLFRIEPPLTPEQRAERQAAAQKEAAGEQARREAANVAKLQARRNQALLQTYSSEKDIELVRQRALADSRAAAVQVELRIAQLKQRLETLDKEAAKYKGGATPAQVEQDTRAAAYELTLQEQQLESRRKELGAIDTRYDEELRKYRQLTGAAKK